MTELALFEAAIAIADPVKRAELLDRKCAGMPEVRARLEELLSAHGKTNPFLDQPLVEGITSDSPGKSVTGEVITHTEIAGTIISGRYKLLQHIGEGGMGAVWMADQTEPVKRRVAVKLIRVERGQSKTILSRFEAERQAIALMDHPNIARLLDAGTTDTGEPYFVMELVKGASLTNFCDSHKLSILERLRLFIQVCSAVQHAHQKGVIHRDLKPSNVLVESHDGKPVPKIIDFGLAKAITGLQLTENTLFTAFGSVMGTPLYMAPEQASASALDVDTRADVYALGIILYELLTGTTPITRESLKKAALDEMLKLIREQEVPTPSSRLSTSESAPSVAANRQTEPAKLGRFVKGELDWIVLKALAKERDRRYETANGFAKDIERFLNHEPVEACPPSTAYKLRKFARRNKILLRTGAAFVLLLTVGAVVSTWQAIRAMDAEAAANSNADQARLNAAEADRNSQQAERNAQQARDEANAKAVALKAEQLARADERKARHQAFDALRSMTSVVVERKFAQGAVLTEEDRAFLRGVIAQFDAFAAIKGDDADSREVRAEGRFRIGTMRKKLGELKEAERDYDQALSIQKQLVADFPSRPELREELARGYFDRGLLRMDKGWLTEAEQDFDQALIIRKQLAGNFSDRPELREDLVRSHISRGILLKDRSRFKEAEKEYDEAVSIQKQLAADFPSRDKFRQVLAEIYTNRANLLTHMGLSKEAEKDYDQAVNIYKQLAADFPTRPELRRDLAKNYHNRGYLLFKLRRHKDAEEDFDQAQSLSRQLAADFPASPEFRRMLALSHGDRARVLGAAGRLKEAELEYERSLSIQEQLATDFPNQPDLRSDVACTCLNLAIVYTGQGNWAAAKRILLEGRPHHLASLKANPQHPFYRLIYRNHLHELTRVHVGLLEQEDAVRTAETCRDLGWDAVADAYDAASFLSRCILIAAKHDKLDDKQRKAAVQFYGDAAMKLLREALSKGYKDVAHMEKDADLEPLLQREDFQNLVSELKGKKK
jgi:serine/threonine protein kinase